MTKKYLLDKIQNGENGLKYIFLKKDEKNILFTEIKETVKIEELGKEELRTIRVSKKRSQRLKSL